MLLCLLYALWILFNARVTGEILLIGIPVTGAVWFLSLKMFSSSPGADLKRLRRVPGAAAYLLYLLKEVILSALHVARLIWTPGQPESGIADFDPALETEPGRVILADSITLTPGTITLEVEKGHFVVHCLERSAGDDLASNEMLSRVRRLEGGRA